MIKIFDCNQITWYKDTGKLELTEKLKHVGQLDMNGNVKPANLANSVIINITLYGKGKPFSHASHSLEGRGYGDS